MGHLRRTSNYPERITLYYLTHMMSMIDLVAISVEIVLGFEVDKTSKILIKTLNGAKYIEFHNSKY